jgi:RNA polymerase sigma-70 factor (ECF subfamily)
VDRWLFAILRSIWLNEIRSRRIRDGGGFVDPENVLTSDGAREIEVNIAASGVLKAIGRLPEAQRETVLLVYGEVQLRGGGGDSRRPDRDGYEQTCHRASGIGEV